jgi:hypothetical protein
LSFDLSEPSEELLLSVESESDELDPLFDCSEFTPEESELEFESFEFDEDDPEFAF